MFFNYSFKCFYRTKKSDLDGNLKDWEDRFLVPDLVEIESESKFADFYMAWNERGLYFAVRVLGVPCPEVHPKRPIKGDGLQVWLDTRNVRDTHRASRYCHHFTFLPTGGGLDGQEPFGRQYQIKRARGQAKLCDPKQLRIASRLLKSEYQMEVYLPSEVLTGFDPEENNRLGFNYLVKDRKLGRQYWTVDESLPTSYDPSLWGIVELVK